MSQPNRADGRPIKIAYTFDRRTDNLAKGLSYEECIIYETDETIEYVAETMRRLGYEVELVGNLEAVVKRLASDPLPDWDLVFNYAEGTTGSAAMREARLPALLEAYGYNCVFADSLGMAQGNHKILTKMILDYHKIPNAPYAIVKPPYSGADDEKSPAQSAIAASPYASRLQTYPLFVKPSCDTLSRGISISNKILSQADLEPEVARLRLQFPDQEVLIEPFLSGREITITIVGTGADARVIGAREMRWPKGNQWEDLDFYGFDRKFRVPEARPDCSHPSLQDPITMKCAEVALAAYRVTGCRDFGRVDVRFDRMGDDATPMVIEVMPIPGMTPKLSDAITSAQHTGIGWDELFRLILESALKRSNQKPRNATLGS